jgi:hypothetical protein
MLAAIAIALLGICTGARASATSTGGHVSPSPAIAGEVDEADEAAQPATPVTVAIDPFDPGRPVPQQFLGLSFEAASLAQLAKYADRGDLVRLLRSLGPGVLRFGGITADENVAWTDAETPRPAWASSVIDEADLDAIGVLARRSGWHVLLTVGLAHYEPLTAAREVAAAHRALGPYLEAVEIGNEPDSYGSHGFRTLPWIAQGYEEEVSSYREAIAALTPDVPLAGPDVSGSGIFSEWGEAEALSQKPALLTGHHYPLGCAQTPRPSIEALLSPAIRALEARSLATYMTVSSKRGIPLRIDETNTVSCGGVAGVSDTFASALWASAYITQAMAAGVDGINLEGNPTNCAGYTPLCAPDASAIADGQLQAEPEWYALLLTRSLIGERPLPTTISAEATPNLVAAAFSAPNHSLRVVLVDDEPPGASPLALRLGVGSGLGTARVLRLSASAPGDTNGVLLAGTEVAANGSWQAPTQPEGAQPIDGVLSLQLQPSSAALVTLPRPIPEPGRQKKHKPSTKPPKP